MELSLLCAMANVTCWKYIRKTLPQIHKIAEDKILNIFIV